MIANDRDDIQKNMLGSKNSILALSTWRTPWKNRTNDRRKKITETEIIHIYITRICLSGYFELVMLNYLSLFFPKMQNADFSIT